MTDELIPEIGREEFDAAIASERPVLVKFTADWCGPCRSAHPTLEGIAHEYEGRLVVRALDVERTPDVSKKYGVRSLPTLILFAEGEELARLSGTRPKQEILDAIAPLISPVGR